MNETVTDNEIDLKELIRAVLATKNAVIVALVLVSVAYWSLKTLGNIAKPSLHTYVTRINLVFEGVNEGRYPNKSPFSISDFVAPVVLNEVYDSNDIEAFLDRKSFVSAFSVAPYVPDRSFILAKYSDQLEQKNLSIAEIASLQAQLQAELENSAADSLSLRFSSTKAGKIPGDLIHKFMNDVPREWARHMIEDVGVAKFDSKIYSSNVVDVALFESIDYLIAFEMLLDRLDLLQKNIEVLKELPNGLVVSDDETQMSVPDLEQAVSDVKRYKVAPLINPVRSLGLAKSPELVKLYFENELIVLNRETSVLQNKKQNVRDAFDAYTRNSNAQTSGMYKGNVSGMQQFETSFIDKLVELTDSGADIKYRQKLNSELLTVSDKIAETTAEIQRIQSILNSMDGQNSVTQSLRESYSSQVNRDMPVIVAQLKGFFDVSTRIYEKLSRSNLGTAGLMYRLTDGHVDKRVSGNILNGSNYRLYFILCFLVTVLVIPVVMIRNSIKKD